jgi:hypothetical protein
MADVTRPLAWIEATTSACVLAIRNYCTKTYGRPDGLPVDEQISSGPPELIEAAVHLITGIRSVVEFPRANEIWCTPYRDQDDRVHERFGKHRTFLRVTI